MARVQAEKRVLSYHERGRCWRKFYRGKMRYIDPRGVAKSDDASYRKAVKNWDRQREIIDAEIELAEAQRDAEQSPSMVNNLRVLHASERVIEATTDERIQRGVGWLKSHQRKSGRWFSPSQSWHTSHLITNAGTAYAVLALEACGEVKAADARIRNGE